MTIAPEIDIQFTGDEETAAAPAPAAPAAAVPSSSPAPSAAAASTPVRSPAGLGALPAFENVPVAKTEVKITGAVTVETRDEITLGLDDRIRVVGEFRVTKVNHYVDKEGKVVRQQVLAPIDSLDIVPWDPMNPLDNGILRAHP